MIFIKLTLKELCAAKVKIFHRISPRTSDSAGTQSSLVLEVTDRARVWVPI